MAKKKKKERKHYKVTLGRRKNIITADKNSIPSGMFESSLGMMIWQYFWSVENFKLEKKNDRERKKENSQTTIEFGMTLNEMDLL